VVTLDYIKDFTIRQAVETEADTLTKIHEECFPRYWNRQAFTDFFAVKDTFALLVEEGDRAIAMMVCRVTFDQADVLTLAVLPAFRRRGIAKMLVEKTLDSCKECGAKKLFLEVEDGNIAALKLYENAGFKNISRRKLYYQQLDGSLTDALVMAKKLD
jgi:ribosomal-protein-alanine N-acetyltransferase